LLASRGGKVTAVSNGREGVLFLKKDPFDLVLADVNTLRPQARKVLPKIKELGCGIPIVLVNADAADEKTVRRMTHLGADLIIPSPLDLDKTLFLVSGSLSNRIADP